MIYALEQFGWGQFLNMERQTTSKLSISSNLEFLQTIATLLMSSQNREDEDMDFSMISKHSVKKDQLNFSVQSLLMNQCENIVEDCIKQTNKILIPPQTQTPIAKSDQLLQQEGSFMKDLQKMQKSLSFESQSYDIFDSQGRSSIVEAPFGKQQTLSHLKKTKDNTKAEQHVTCMNDYGYLIVDFTKKRHPTNVRISGDIKNHGTKLLAPHINELKRSKVSSIHSKQSSKSLFKHNHQIISPGESKSKKFLKDILSPKHHSKGFKNAHPQIFTENQLITTLPSSRSKSKRKLSKSKSLAKNKSETLLKTQNICKEYFGQILLKSERLRTNEHQSDIYKTKKAKNSKDSRISKFSQKSSSKSKVGLKGLKHKPKAK